ncbi:unnamed protein product [Arabidopsis lyrata]|uniref:Uncharacterized protein n=1 Tax=Arabidopsis lyrata subsp. lyrata TaxID=81972 RepID=D7KES5_ARALL|nr:uncharacterized protein LOC9329670 [Arabidopsis lyrata subsp. lyrata]EFH69868.1 hypothetical protein ARALYDRAFT_890566 [Arabidopsis lyrata subsp. lyrata]CAH8253958.1 unnamed protein product [Arabidopsis lyrata]|eukprot:XP_002893609.1 uncharacterized protein LOC9329670 [Arabidopsis lyrata subsp. lyrata]
MVDTQNTLFVFRQDQQVLAPQPRTPFSAVTAHRATAIRRCRLMISVTTLEMILEEEITPEEGHPNITPAIDSLAVVFPVTSCF